MTVFLLIGALGGAAVVGYLIGILSGIAMMRRQMTDELCREQTAHKQSLTYLVRNGCQDWSPEVQYRKDSVCRRGHTLCRATRETGPIVGAVPVDPLTPGQTVWEELEYE